MSLSDAGRFRLFSLSKCEQSLEFECQISNWWVLDSSCKKCVQWTVLRFKRTSQKSSDEPLSNRCRRSNSMFSLLLSVQRRSPCDLSQSDWTKSITSVPVLRFTAFTLSPSPLYNRHLQQAVNLGLVHSPLHFSPPLGTKASEGMSFKSPTHVHNPCSSLLSGYFQLVGYRLQLLSGVQWCHSNQVLMGRLYCVCGLW